MTLDIHELARQLDDEVGSGPPVPPIGADLRRGRARLRRRRAGEILGGLAVASAIATLVATVGIPGRSGTAGVAAAPQRTDAEIVAACSRAASGALADGSVQTRSSSREGTVATVLSADGSHWGDCQLPVGSDHGNEVMTVYPTSIEAKSAGTVHGVRKYVPWNLNTEPGDTASFLGPSDGFPTCRVTEPEETSAYAEAKSRCPYFELVWNDRRPPEVTRVELVAPDGKHLSADVSGGYISLDYTGRMTPALRAKVAEGGYLEARSVTFFGPDGQRLVADDHPMGGARPGRLSIADWPSLAYGDGR